MRELVLTPKFKRAFRKFVKRNSQDVFDAQLGSHSLQEKLLGLKACSCGYDCRILFTIEIADNKTEMIVLLDIGTHDEVY